MWLLRKQQKDLKLVDIRFSLNKAPFSDKKKVRSTAFPSGFYPLGTGDGETKGYRFCARGQERLRFRPQSSLWAKALWCAENLIA